MIAFNGNARWLQVGVRTNGSSSDYTISIRASHLLLLLSHHAGNVPEDRLPQQAPRGSVPL